MRDFARSANPDWQAAKAAAGLEGRGTVVIRSPGGETATMHWDSVENRFGVRVDTHKFPILGGYWEQPLSEDVNRFSLNGWITGKDYLKQRDQLSKVLHTRHDSDQPLVLELPTYEPLAVLFHSGSQKENGHKGGIVELSLQFSRVLDVKPTIATQDAGAQSEIARQGVLAALAADVDAVADKANRAWKSGSAAVVGALAVAKSAVGLAKNTAAEISVGILEVQNAIEQASQTPGEIVNALGSVVATLGTAVQATPGNLEREARRLQRYFLSWANYSLPAVATVPEQRVRNASENTLRALGVIGTAQNLPLLKPQGIGDARELAAQYRQMEGSLGEPSAALLVALEQQRIALHEQLKSQGWFSLAFERKILVEGMGLNSIALGQSMRAKESLIRTMNDVQNAFFVSGLVKYV